MLKQILGDVEAMKYSVSGMFDWKDMQMKAFR